MKKNSTVIIVLVLVVVVILVLLISSLSKQNNLNNNSVNPTGQNTNTPVLFSDSPLSQNAYLISIPTFDANTKIALSGFNVTKSTLADGSMQIVLNSTNPDYQTQTYTVKSGEKLYFIEANLGDDGNNNDGNVGDDTAVLVDANGFIVNQ
jgi:hypothetical protein